MKDKTKAIILGAAASVAVTVTLFYIGYSGAPTRVAARALPDDTDTTPVAVAAAPATPRDSVSPASVRSLLPATVPTPPAASGNESPSSLTFGDHWDQRDSAPPFSQFAEWVARYRAARSNEERAELEAEGLRLAQDRRAALSALIRENPEEALGLAIPYSVQRELPDGIAAELEQTVSGRGSISVFAALAEPGKEHEVPPVWRTATIGEAQYDAFVYGRRLGEPTRRDVPLNGIVLGHLLALSVNPVRVLSAAEAAARFPVNADPVCAVSGQSANVNQTPTAAEVGGKFMRVCGIGHAADLNTRLIRAEADSGSNGLGGDDLQASAYTEGVKRLLVIRVDFSDLVGDPFPTNNGTSLISGLNDFYRESSFGRTGFQLNGSGSSVTPTLRMPQTASYYGANNLYTQLQNDARAAATAAGFNTANYDFDLTCFGAVPGWGWAGLGWVGAPGVWLRSYFTAGVAGHELGHNYGLNHANYWDTSGQSVIGTGSSIEYGDIFDTMGSANAGANHFNARYKNYLNWLTTAEVQTVTNSGTYRIYAHDDTNSSGIRALKIARNSNTNFWVEFRQKFTGNTWMMNGAGIRWAGNGNQRSDLLDTTPGSANGKNDSALVVGRTFSDRASGIHITTLRKAGTSPEALDVVVNLGTFPANTPPTVAVSGSSTAAVGATATFNATASDANGDSLAYYWDFGDGTFGTNGAAASKSWNLTGDYLVQCTVTDMKGGTASDSVIVTVGTPFTYRISGQVTIGGAPAVGARVYVSTTRMAYTDSDGTYSIVGLPASSYTVSVSLDGYSFVASGFANPVSVGPNASGINFLATGFVSVALTSPTNNTTFISPSSVMLAANAAAAAGNTLTRVEFYQGTTKLGEDTTSPFSYSWSSPATGSYTLRAVATDNGGLIATSAPVSIVVSSGAPAITSQPQNVTVAAGGNATFSVTATGAGPLSYTWRCSGTNVTGGSSATLSLTSVQLSQAGSYSVVVTNLNGSVTSGSATLTVLQAPSITAQPADLSVGVGASAAFAVTATGTAPLTYQWRKNGTTMSGSNGTSIQFNPASLPDAAGYSVVVANGVGSITSRVATLSVVQAPLVTTQPQGRTVAAGSNVTISVTVAGSSPLVYQWSKDGLALTGSTNSFINLPSAAPADTGGYSVIVTNQYGSATSSVATLVVNCAYGLSAVNASFNWTGGSGSANLSTHSACSWTIANVPVWITLTSPSSGNGNATLTYTVASNASASARSATLSVAGISYQVTQSALDVTPPAVAISSPAAGFTTTQTPLLVQGTASDNASLNRVEWRVGTNAFVSALGTTSWSASVPLALGTNVLSVRAIDASGNVSVEQQRSFVLVEPGTILVNVNGHGSVRGATNGQKLNVGKAYSLTAVPEAGYAFSNWTGSIVRYSSTLAFVMETNLLVTANFVPNPFESSKGTFNGLFYETNQVQQDRAGFFTFAMTSKGSYSASLLTRGLKLKAKGALTLDGRATNQIAVPGGTTYTVTWGIALDGSDQITGVVSASGWQSPLLGDRLVYHPKTNAAPQNGRYTFVVLGNPGQNAAPGGDSYGTASVNTKGGAQLSAYLADNTRLVARASISKDGNWPVYASLYGRQGAILGWLTFRDRPTTDLDGLLSWTRPAIPGSPLYPQGFTSEAATIGSRFGLPTPGQAVADWTDPIARFEGGGLPGSITNSITFNGATVVNQGPTPMTLKISPGSGLFSGAVTPDSGGPLAFRGVVVQKASLGSGYFLGPDGSGLIAIEERLEANRPE